MTNSAPSERSDTQKDQTPSEGRWGSIRKWFENNWSQVLLFVGGLALYFLLGLLLWWLLQRYVDPSAIKDPSKEATAKKDLLQALGLIMAGVAGAIGIYFTWRGQRITRKGLEDTQKSTEEQLRLTREGQITERFTRAIEQLGATNDDNSKNLELRLGGIYALERIARESEEDYWSIMEVLTAYVRQNSPRRAFEGQQAGEDAAVEKSENDSAGSMRKSEPTDVHAPDPDIQAVTTVLRRRNRSFGNGEPERLDLSETNLTGAFLTEAHLSEANLTEANLTGANLTQEQLEKTYGDENTRLPPGLKPPAHWNVKTDGQAEGD